VTARRRRGALLLSVALASGGLAASQVHERERRAAERLGPLVDVLVAARDLPAGARVRRDGVGLRRVPARFAPPDALTSGAGVVGARVAASVPAGGYLGAGLFGGPESGRGRDPMRRGERAVTVEVAGGLSAAGLTTGRRVDVLVSTETGAGGRTQMALAGAELLGIGEASSGGYPEPAPAADPTADPAAGPTALATLRVTLRQAIYLTAADNFASEIRLLPRPPGDRLRPGGAISQSQL
jgi:pilus assembly protein CpaB